MSAPASTSLTLSAPTQYVDVAGRRLAYRSIGAGKPIVFCTRFRGNLDLWDPVFLDGLAEQGFRVITFDYSGLGLSSGEKTYNPASLAKDALDLIDALDLKDVVIGGWSIGGIAAQLVLATAPQRISHVVLIATTPPGELVKTAEQLFYDTAAKPVNDLEDFVVLFFEPRSTASREAARLSMARMSQRTADLSVPVPGEWAAAALGGKPRNPVFPVPAVLEALKTTKIPVLHIGGDHDIVFPVENWYALNGQLPTLQLLTLPQAGHGPQHQYPEAAAEHIGTFIRTTAASK
jgi:pimeloyl-ACP methyl ester carboxylesterase